MTTFSTQCPSKRARWAHPHNPAFYREADLVQRLLPISASTLWRMVRRGDFPKPVKLAPRVTAWPAHVVDSWIEQRREAQA